MQACLFKPTPAPNILSNSCTPYQGRSGAHTPSPYFIGYSMDSATESLYITLQYTGNDTITSTSNFLPFGRVYGDSTAPMLDDGYTDEIQLGTDIVIFGSHHNRLYVSRTVPY